MQQKMEDMEKELKSRPLREQQRIKREVGAMIRKDLKDFHKFVDFWKQEVDSSEKTPHIKNLAEYLEKLGHRNIAICMLHEKQLKIATVNDLIQFLTDLIFKNLHRVENGDFHIKIATDSESLKKIH